jgi:hypothetical protein
VPGYGHASASVRSCNVIHNVENPQGLGGCLSEILIPMAWRGVFRECDLHGLEGCYQADHVIRILIA